MRLFEDIQRDYLGPRRYSESSFAYLNRSARDQAGLVREILEKWAERFATAAQSDLIERFRSRDDAQHLGALLEMYCSELIRAHDYAVEPHPSTDTQKSTHPDFLVLKRETPICYLECTLAADPFVDRAEQARKNTVLDGLNMLDPGPYFVTVAFEAIGGTSPSITRLRREIQAWLRSLDAEEGSDQWSASQSQATRTWTIDGWTLTFHAYRSPERRPSAWSRGIAGHMEGMRFVDSSGRLRSSLSQKANRYGSDLGLPYVVMLNSLDDILEDCDVMDALFGKMQYSTSISTGHTREERVRNGLWIRAGGFKYRRMSGVIVVGNLTPWTLWTAPAKLWHHPDALHPLDPSDWRIPQMLPDNMRGEMITRSGESAASVLGLHRPKLG